MAEAARAEYVDGWLMLTAKTFAFGEVAASNSAPASLFGAEFKEVWELLEVLTPHR